MPNFNELSDILSQHLTVNKPKIECLSQIIQGLIQSRSVSLNKIAQYFNVIALKRDNQIINTQMVDMPVYDELFRTGFSENSNQYFNKKSNALKINKRNEFSVLHDEIEVISSPNP